MIKAPSVTSLRILKLSANQVHIAWDDVGSNFYYMVEIAETHTQAGEAIPPANYTWRNLGYTAQNDWFEQGSIYPDTYYKMRVQVTANGFTQSDWVETEEFLTFHTNAYTLEHMRQFTPSSNFINKKLVNNDMQYINLNTDIMMASLMGEGFVYSPSIEDASSVSPYMVREGNYHEIQGDIKAVCADINRVMLAEMDGVLYLFERFQPVVKVSNDKGQNWKYYKAFTGRVGNPVSRTCVYQSKDTTYVLGYDRIFLGTRSSDVRWSSDKLDEAFSENNDHITFTKNSEDNQLGFDVEIFGDFAYFDREPFLRYAEAMCCNDENLYVAARNRVIHTKLRDTRRGDQGGPFEGKYIFEPGATKIVANNDRIVVKKMDSCKGRIFALVIGETKVINGVPYPDPTNRDNVIPSKDAGVYMLSESGLSWSRIFGNKPEELRVIENEYTNLSTNGEEIFVNFTNFRWNELVADPETKAKYPEVVKEAVRFKEFYGYNTPKKIHMSCFRAHNDDFRKWTIDYQEYYNEANYTWMARSGVRTWITNQNRALVVYPQIEYTKVIDDAGVSSEDRINKEVWVKGEGTFYLKNISFEGFNQYASGILIYRNDGAIFGYYEFEWRTRDEARLIWKPKNVALVAKLQNQEHEVPWVPKGNKGEQDPDLRPMLYRMKPDSYILEDTNFEKFSEYYLQFISDGNGTYYNKLLNLIRHKYPREEHAYEWLWSEINKRNIYLDKTKREAVVRFFEARKSDFYATKGIEQSYKFLFKLLYNEEVEIEIESKSGLEYDILVQSDNISQDIVGRTIYTPTGRCNVTYIERDYVQGKLQWRMTIHNMLGRFIDGQELKAERSEFMGMIVRGIQGKDMLSNTIEYINRNRSYYVMKIRSVLPTSRYANDVLRFVHPVGFGFIGITVLTMFINAGLSMKHTETIINRLKTYRFDAGLPSYWPDRVADLDVNGNIKHDVLYQNALYLPHPNAGQAFPLRAGYDAENNNSMLWGKKPSERRRDMSPLFDQSAVTFSQFRDMVSRLIASPDVAEPYRFKDDYKNPRDVSGLRVPQEPTQVKVDD